MSTGDETDTTEALDLLARWSEGFNTQLSDRIEAAGLLLKELFELGKTLPKQVVFEDREGYKVSESNGYVSTFLFVDENGQGIRVGDRNDPSDRELLQLDYDPKAKKWLGKEIDENLVGEPGKRRPKRSALAIVAEGAIKHAKAPARR